jgi:ubiquinone/menaquinone biosynthesis C-methylase UbiE
MEKTLAQRILDENVKLHRQEAAFYDQLHVEIFNAYEQSIIRRDLAYIAERQTHTLRSALDLGCGTGNVTLKLAILGYSVDAVDLSESMLNILRPRVSGNVRIIHNDADSFIATNEKYYDVITFSSVLHHLPDYKATLSELVEHLNPGGFLYITHEPLPRAERLRPDPLQSALSFMCRKTRGLIRRIRRRPMFALLDYTMSDFHLEQGISPEEIATSLQPLGLSVHLIRRYRSEHCATVALINNTILNQRPHQFTIIAQKGV